VSNQKPWLLLTTGILCTAPLLGGLTLAIVGLLTYATAVGGGRPNIHTFQVTVWVSVSCILWAYLVACVCLMDLWRQRRTNSELRILWTVLLIAMPQITVLAYWYVHVWKRLRAKTGAGEMNRSSPPAEGSA
jgi:amino acid transporter